MKANISIRNYKGGYERISIFDFFNDGVIKKTPKLMAKRFRDMLIDNIDKNKFGFQLSQIWLRKKKRMGADDRPFIAFGDYKKEIRIIEGKNRRLEVGFLKNKKHPRAGRGLGQLALMLEFGDVTAKIPSRPLWRMTIEEFRQRYSKV